MSHLGHHLPPLLLTVATAIAVVSNSAAWAEVARERADLAGRLPAGAALRNRYGFAGVDDVAQQFNRFRR